MPASTIHPSRIILAHSAPLFLYSRGVPAAASVSLQPLAAPQKTTPRGENRYAVFHVPGAGWSHCVSRHIFDMIRRGQTSELAADVEDHPDLAAVRDAQGVSALLWSVYTGQTVIRDFLLPRLPELDLFEAAAVGDAARLKILLQADPAAAQSFSGDGWTALHLAAAFASPEAAKVLLAHGGDVHARSKNPLNNQPLHAAISLNSSTEMARLLLDAGADVNAKQAGGYTPLHQASSAGKKELVLLLLERGADRSAVCDQGKTPAEYARERNRNDLMELLSSAAGV
jgi:hypothetical protein